MADARIQDYALIGDGRSAALVSNSGSIDWLCWPRFDSPALFSAVLDPDKGGCWRIAPTAAFRTQRAYAQDSNVLVTTFQTSAGSVRLTDLMPVFSEEDKQRTLVPEHEVLRLVEGIEGEVELEVQFQPRPDYGRRLLPLRRTKTLGIRLEDGPHLYTLRADTELQDDASDGVNRSSLSARFRMRAGERRHFSLTYDAGGPAVLPPLGSHSQDAVDRSNRWWSTWARRCAYEGPYREQVIRSVLALKLLSFAPSGAIIAAPTTSLPEKLGGDLNWDYRFCWVRDASLTVRALFDLGYQEEAEAFVSWLLMSTRLTRPQFAVLYDVYGDLPMDEEILPHLAGHRGSRPVRIRNAAAGQLQLDGYGEVIDAVVQMCRRGTKLDREMQTMLRQLGTYVCENWHRPDNGMWEPRGVPAHHVHSRVLCWTALDRLLELVRMGALTRVPEKMFAENCRNIRRDIEGRGWNPALRSYTDVLGGDLVDASLLLMSWYGFSKASDPRMQHTFARIRQRLEVAPGLYYRYEASRTDGEGAFGICGFWAVEFLARGGGSLDDARRCFEGLLGYGNDVGLFAEEIAVETGEALGNFPQAFTHVGLIGAALALEERRREEEATPSSKPHWGPAQQSELSP
ncbi:MAG TPA: glycoside hydrolase family 15 protein [Polyangia bacterium]|nr:glycoside hydrolase family 15 protein [Polyangia bacterium]